MEDIFRHDPNTNINKKPAEWNLGYPIRARRAGNISMKYSRDMRNLVSRSAFQDKFVHFQVNNDVTEVVRNRIWCTVFQLSINLVCRVILPKFDVILTIRSRVCTWIIHFTTGLVIFEVNDDVTVAVRSRFLHLFWTKMVIDILKISLVKFELILKRRSRVWT